MFKYLEAYNSSIENNDGVPKAGRAARVDIGSPDARRLEKVLTPVINYGSRGRHNDAQNTIVTGDGNRIDESDTMRESNAKVADSTRNFTVRNDSTDDANSSKRIEALTNRVYLGDKGVNNSLSADHPAIEVQSFSALRNINEDVDIGPDVTGSKTTMQSHTLEKESKETAELEAEVDDKMESKKPDNGLPSSRGFVLPYLPKTPSGGNSRSSNHSSEDSSQIFDSNARNNNEEKLPESSSKKFRSAD